MIFVDTSYWVAARLSRDHRREAAVALAAAHRAGDFCAAGFTELRR